MDAQSLLRAYGACRQAEIWACQEEITTVEELWERCPSVEWLFWGILKVRRDGISYTEACRYKDKLLDLVELPDSCREVADLTKKIANGATDLWGKLYIAELSLRPLVDVPGTSLSDKYVLKLVATDLAPYHALSYPLSNAAEYVQSACAFRGKPLGRMVIPDIVRGLFPDTLERFKEFSEKSVGRG